MISERVYGLTKTQYKNYCVIYTELFAAAASVCMRVCVCVALRFLVAGLKSSTVYDLYIYTFIYVGWYTGFYIHRYFVFLFDSFLPGIA